MTAYVVVVFKPKEGFMHFARQVSKHISLHKAGLGFLSMPAIKPRTFGHANRMSEEGSADDGESGITRYRRSFDD